MVNRNLAKIIAAKRKYRQRGRKPRFFRRRFSRIPRMSVNVHKYTRWESADRTIVLAAVASPGAATAFDAHAFTLAALDGASEFTALYDQYTITHVQAHIMWAPKNTSGTFTATTNSFFASGVGNPILYYKRDYDDANVPTGLAEFKQSNKTKMVMLRPGKQIVVNIKPAVSAILYESVATNSYSPKWRQRIDCSDDSCPHYAMKYAIDYLNATDMGQVTIRYKYWVKLFNTR